MQYYMLLSSNSHMRFPNLAILVMIIRILVEFDVQAAMFVQHVTYGH